MIKRIIFPIVLIIITGGLLAQKLPAGITEANYFVRTIHSGGAFPSKEQVVGDVEVRNTATNISEQYFLFLQTKKCRKAPQITSLSIDGINFEYEVVQVPTPFYITNQNGNKEVLVKNTKNKVYQVKVGKAIFVQNQKGFKKGHTIMIEGKLKGRSFSHTRSATPLASLKAQ
jgi:hypothetical protein